MLVKYKNRFSGKNKWPLTILYIMSNLRYCRLSDKRGQCTMSPYQDSQTLHANFCSSILLFDIILFRQGYCARPISPDIGSFIRELQFSDG